MTADPMMFIYTGMALGGMFALMFSYLYFNVFRWTGFLRQVTRKNYGIIYFYTRGRALMPKIVNFGGDILRTNKGLWVLYDGAIYRQISKEENQNPETLKIPVQDLQMQQPKSHFWSKARPIYTKIVLHKEIKPSDINYRQGLPIMFLNTEDMIPMYLASEQTTRIVRNPQMIEAVLGKEVAAAELEALKMTKKTLKWLVIGAIIVGIICAGIQIITYMRQEQIGAMVYNLTQQMNILLPPAAGGA